VPSSYVRSAILTDERSLHFQLRQNSRCGLEKLLQELRSKHPNYSKKDEIEAKLAKLFDGKVGAQYPPEVLQTTLQKAAQRFAEKIPQDTKTNNRSRDTDVTEMWFSGSNC
ncbi:MAG: PIN-like domain-containing protein, partial [Candidatus Sulfotelmatobacter sp.]